MDWLKAEWQKRPWWMNLIFLFCLYMTFIYMPFDMFFKPVAEDVEVWFGFALYGWWAKATEPLHWLIYGFGAYGFWQMKRWLHPWAAIYVLQIGVAMLVFAGLRGGEMGWLTGLIPFIVFGLIAVALWMSRERFGVA